MTTSGSTPRRLNDAQAATYAQILAKHTSDPKTGLCPHCHRHRCDEWVFARTQLTLDGRAAPLAREDE